jgi:hypothetical protein
MMQKPTNSKFPLFHKENIGSYAEVADLYSWRYSILIPHSAWTVPADSLRILQYFPGQYVKMNHD